MSLILEKKDNKEITPKHPTRTLSGIDALYFHIDISYAEYSEFYMNHVLKGIFEKDESYINLKPYEVLGANQYIFYKVLTDKLSQSVSDGQKQVLCTICFKNLNKKDNLFSIKVQMDSMTMQRLGYKSAYNEVLELIKGYGIVPLTSVVNRLDLNTYVIGHDFSYIDYNNFVTRMRRNGINADKHLGSELYRDGVSLTGFNLGSRGNGLYMRIYNKFKHIHDTYANGGELSMSVITEKYYQKYNEDMTSFDIWQVEFELKREELKRYNINTVEDVFQKADGLHKDIVSNRIRMILPIRTKKRDNKTTYIWKIIEDDYVAFTPTSEALEPNRHKIYMTTPQDKLYSFCEKTLDTLYGFDTMDTNSITEIKEFMKTLRSQK